MTRSYGPKKRTKRDRDIAAFMLAVYTNPTPATEAGLAAKVDALAAKVDALVRGR